MKIALKLNIGNFQNIDIESTFENKLDCYKQISDVLKDWIDITENAKKLKDHLGLILRSYLEALDPDLEYPRVEQEVITKSNLQTDTEPMGGDDVPPPKKGKYTWYPVKGGGKVRKCNNEPCPYFLKYEGELGTYQHGKYDPNTKVWSYITDMCEFYGEGK